MEFKELLLKRRSVRKFKAQAVEKEKIDVILHAAMSGPSACNLRPWEFYIVSNPEKLQALKATARYTKMDAPLAIIVCGNLKRAFKNKLAEYWVQDCSAASENILLRACDLGLGAVWCGIYPQELPVQRVQSLLELPEEQIPLNVIFIGYPDEEPEARDQYDENYVHYID